MAFLDFIKQHSQAAQPQKPSQSIAQTGAPKQDISRVVPAADLARARAVGERLKQATVHMQAGPNAGASGGNNALLQKQQNQDKTQAALSPTDQFKGQTVVQQRARGRER